MTPLDETYWSKRYNTHDTGWDAGSITTPLKAYIDQLTDKNISILIPGCGNSYEAVYLLEQGFTHITLIDISTALCNTLENRLQAYIPGRLQIICGDFFEHTGAYDLVLEQTFFCALDPVLRPAYAVKMQSLLNNEGKLAGLFFNRPFEGGPPFGGSVEEYKKLLSPYFELKTVAPCYNSIAPRAGAEAFAILIKKSPGQSSTQY